jgi:acyl carrier protein
MADNPVARSIERLCELPADSLTRSAVLTEIPGWDSLRVVEFVATLDSEYGITVDFEKMAGCVTVGDLSDLVEGARKS